MNTLKSTNNKDRNKYLRAQIMANLQHHGRSTPKTDPPDEWIGVPESSVIDNKNRLLHVALYSVVLTLVFVIGFSSIIFTYLHELLDSRDEYDALASAMDVLDQSAADKTDSPIIPKNPNPRTTRASAFDTFMREMNRDYVCWLNIEGTPISYPVVRGDDNERYLSESFLGTDNTFGTLFLDYRCVGEYVPNIIIYGHNSRYGDMFGSLSKFLDNRHLDENPVIALKTNDRAVEYVIFSARRTDINDPAYQLDFNETGSFQAFAERCGAPADAGQIVTLSTCVGRNDPNERIIVQGMIRNPL